MNGPLLKALIAAGIFSMAMNLLVLAVPIYMWQVYSRVLTTGRVETLLLLTLIAGFALLVFGCLEIVRQRLLARISTWLGAVLFDPIVNRLVRAGRLGTHLGAQPVRDLQQVRSFLGGQGITCLFDAPWIPIFLILLFSMHSMLGWIGTVGTGVMLGLVLLSEWRIRSLVKRINHSQNTLNGRIEAASMNGGVLEAMGMTGNLIANWQGLNVAILQGQQKVADRTAFFLGATKFFRLFLQIAVLGAGALLVLEDKLGAGGMIAAAILLTRALAPVEQAVGTWRSLTSARDAGERLSVLLRSIPAQKRGISAPEIPCGVEAESLFYTPRGQKHPTVQGVSFALGPGETLAVTGPSGAGKSTLCKLVVGALAQSDGSVKIGGIDAALWDPAQRYRYIGYLPQDVQLFAGTIRTNIARLASDPPPDLVDAAVFRGGVQDLIDRLPHGYDTDIGNNGDWLSGGQRQRIGLARALYGDPKLVVLDEPNANLDEDGTAALVAAIRDAKERGTTMILVVHNASLLQYADKILCLRDGQVEAFGDRDEILHGGKYTLLPAADDGPQDTGDAGTRRIAR